MTPTDSRGLGPGHCFMDLPAFWRGASLLDSAPLPADLLRHVNKAVSSVKVWRKAFASETRCREFTGPGRDIGGVHRNGRAK
jgi:hypothetical protein